eukprot:COSAG01_NODE_115_length_25561_cov_103.183450_10_plen_50_part_00
MDKDLAKLESLKVPTAVKGKKRRSIKGPPLEASPKSPLIPFASSLLLGC